MSTDTETTGDNQIADIQLALANLQTSFDEATAHFERWCERLQDAMDEHLRVCAETAALMLSTHAQNGPLLRPGDKVVEVQQGAPASAV